MAWADYESVTWFVQGSSADERGTLGSAVAVRVLRQGEKTPKTYLLTCAHVVRGSNPDVGAGPVLETLQAWRSGSGFVEAEARSLQVAAAAHNSMDKPTPKKQRTAPFDWVLLEIKHEDEALAAPAVPRWAGPNPEGRFLVCGYPGEQPFTRSVVKPTVSGHHLTPHESDLGVLRLVGHETRPGMSGGGLFDADGLFIGIHRSKRDAEMKLVAVSADHIRKCLRDKGFDVVTDAPPADSTPAAELARILGGGAFRDAHWRAVRDRWLPKPSTHSTPRNLGDGDAQVADLWELEQLGPDEHGVRPLHGFALDLNQLTPAGPLGEWIKRHIPLGVRTTVQEPAAAPSGEPRIVVEMTPLGPVGNDPALRSIEYKVWFVGFRRSPPYRRQVDQLDQFSAVLGGAWEEVRGQADLKQVWVELFVPKQLLAWKFESLDIRLGKFPVRIGATQPFSLRLNREDPLRLEGGGFNRCLRICRYGSLASIPNTCGSHVLVEVPGDSDPGDLFTALQGKENVLGVLWTSHPQTAENDDGDVWDAVSQAGIPLVVWLRDLPEPRPDVGVKFDNTTWDELAGVVKNLRNEGAREKKAWHPGQHLAVILDDDRRSHPERGSPFRSPHAPAT